MARWLREHLGFRSAKPAPPAPPKPDYRAGPPPQPPPPPGGAAEPLAAAQPDIVAAYRLQKERDFEDPYSAAPPPATPDGPRYISPKHRLIKVEATEKVPASPPPLPPAASSSSPAGPELPEEPPQELAVLEDYADPFDAAQVAGSQAGLEKVAENDGYMEPYEAQKMMAEIRQKGLRDAPARPLHLYDTPYEPVLGGLDMDGDRLTCSRPRESRLPEDDERPPEEYDQPWEWKKERISKAFAVEIKVIKDLPWPPPVGQLDSGESPLDGEAGASVPPQHGQPSYEDANGPSEGLGYGRTSPCREEKARATLRHGSSSLKSTKMLIAEPGPFVGERIDPALPLESQCCGVLMCPLRPPELPGGILAPCPPTLAVPPTSLSLNMSGCCPRGDAKGDGIAAALGQSPSLGCPLSAWHSQSLSHLQLVPRGHQPDRCRDAAEAVQGGQLLGAQQ
ncbi:SH2 domain-containing adapter protein F isoform X1 [Falco naumanni]|uniref:SH2 domain-containing adapter protein F isoform X1 n=1 Tax=Falco naumanni TaxID=148594 RepID=UPI001ADE44DF|nr:SH2 domain-containing adapter protein F isoform X1 [Falco naumanni]XP_040455834.1 SH2 domain-containing adapter protein F isoform X1 [Falco naumanni]